MTAPVQNFEFLFEVVRRERSHVVTELHDGVCQNLCAVLFQLRLMERRVLRECPALESEYGAAMQNLDTTVEQARALFRKLQPPITGRTSLVLALRDLVKINCPSTTCDFHYKPFVHEIEAPVAMAAYHIAHEAQRFLLSRPEVDSLQTTLARRADKFQLTVSTPMAIGPIDSERIAIRIMQLLAASANGDLRIEGEKNRENTFIFTAPLKTKARAKKGRKEDMSQPL